MFAPPVTDGRSKADADLKSRQGPPIVAPRTGRSFGDAMLERPASRQPDIGNHALLRRLAGPARPANQASHGAWGAAAETNRSLVGEAAARPPSVHVVDPHEDEEQRAPTPEKAPDAAAEPASSPAPSASPTPSPTPTPSPAPQEAPQIAVVPAQPKPASLEAVQALAQRPGVPISGPPAPDTLAHVWSTGNPRDGGFTQWPAGYRAPDFDFRTTSNAKALPEDPEWYSEPIARAASFEGTSASFYIAAGKYKTTLLEGGKDVYWNFSPAISDLIRVGEQEHCDDFAEAYRISLKEADTVMNGFIVGKHFGPKHAKAEAEQMVLAEIGARLTHKQLGNDKSQWAAKYAMLYDKTRTRDVSGWHSITLAARTADASGNITYEVVKGSATIPGPASNTIIKYRGHQVSRESGIEGVSARASMSTAWPAHG